MYPDTVTSEPENPNVFRFSQAEGRSHLHVTLGKLPGNGFVAQVLLRNSSCGPGATDTCPGPWLGYLGPDGGGRVGGFCSERVPEDRKRALGWIKAQLFTCSDRVSPFLHV